MTGPERPATPAELVRSNREIAALFRSGRLHQHLRGLVAPFNPDTIDRLIAALTVHVLSARTTYGSWQAAWNDYIGPAGLVRLPAGRCRQCRGQGWSVKRPGPGFPICSECHGSRRGQPVTLRAQPADLPNQGDPPDAA